MAIVNDEIDLSPPHSRPSTPNFNIMTEETPCQQLVRTTVNIKRFTTTRDGYKQILTTLENDPSHDPTNALYVKILKNMKKFLLFLTMGKTAKRVLLENPNFQINLENRFTLPSTASTSEFPALPTIQQNTTQLNQAGVTTSFSTATLTQTSLTGVTSSSNNTMINNSTAQKQQPKRVTCNSSARILRLPIRTADATEPRCLGNPHQLPSYNRASDFCSPYQSYLDRADSTSSLPLSGNGNDTDMANLPTDMELELALSQRNSTRTPSPQPQLTPCEQLKFNKAQLAKMETFRKCKQACVDALQQMHDHYPEEPFFVRALTELQDVEETMAIAVSDIDSYDPCTIPGCPHHEKNPINSPTKLTQSTPQKLVIKQTTEAKEKITQLLHIPL
ncbi:hypothetical protein TNIN_168671 [Trichonephila inaurata madagascariensis]|uniref:Uncharacterized protein n=1 Tax=Trichonephila inaurata madagascariensis TaxID=2747483 RepID=A0A8X6M9C5_9ARAC|nr:hypothetical protein TNIN_168671 [Trichonephila inaurata madagascariensis]